MLELESSTGLSDLSEGERNVLAALLLCGGASGAVPPGDLRRHVLAAGLTHPTYHRVLRGLLGRGLVRFDGHGAPERGYTLALDIAARDAQPQGETA
jgi:DNA-binding MarR family transcriptional regulator